MSINDFLNKIKGKLGIDTFTIMCLFVIIGVGIGAFGLGRLSVVQTNSNDDEVLILENKENISFEKEINKKKMYVASKSGKLYYTIGCSGAKRISEKNKIYFETSSDARKSGYSFASSCK